MSSKERTGYVPAGSGDGDHVVAMVIGLGLKLNKIKLIKYIKYLLMLPTLLALVADVSAKLATLPFVTP